MEIERVLEKRLILILKWSTDEIPNMNFYMTMIQMQTNCAKFSRFSKTKRSIFLVLKYNYARFKNILTSHKPFFYRVLAFQMFQSKCFAHRHSPCFAIAVKYI